MFDPCATALSKKFLQMHVSSTRGCMQSPEDRGHSSRECQQVWLLWRSCIHDDLDQRQTARSSLEKSVLMGNWENDNSINDRAQVSRHIWRSIRSRNNESCLRLTDDQGSFLFKSRLNITEKREFRNSCHRINMTKSRTEVPKQTSLHILAKRNSNSSYLMAWWFINAKKYVSECIDIFMA